MENTKSKEEIRREQLRAAQKRWRDKKKLNTVTEPREEPKSYTKEYRKAYHKTYYQNNRERILNRIRRHIIDE